MQFHKMKLPHGSFSCQEKSTTWSLTRIYFWEILKIAMKDDFPPHRLVPIVIDKIKQKILEAKIELGSDAAVAERCNTSSETIQRTRTSKRGTNLTLNMALKIWEGLGNDPGDLIPSTIKTKSRIFNGFSNEQIELIDNVIEIINESKHIDDGVSFEALKSVTSALFDKLVAKKISVDKKRKA